MLSFSTSLYPRHKNKVHYYLEGDRFLSVLHARIRNQCSRLNYDLFKNNYLRDNPFCMSLLEPEDAEHFLYVPFIW